ncbi:hypothetical protein bcere0013_25990 [Bacillus cereus BDRD-ST26]|nr:hypothetical protein bcere0013_25990 [Bacillus cereus BDRD-ST26]
MFFVSVFCSLFYFSIFEMIKLLLTKMKLKIFEFISFFI